MAIRTSAGLLMFRKTRSGLEVLLAHPGGPFFAKKDQGVWTIPKGEIDSGEEDLLERAKIEFEEELGIKPAGDAIPLGSITQKGGKIVHGWAIEGDLPADFKARSNTFQLEWPPRSGKIQSFPEVDRAAFFSLDEAARKIKSTQQPFLDRLLEFVQARDCSG
jgi:predicted NUDIX family NTP pyrophosphohydrolase